MHHLGRLSETSGDAGAYEGHSERLAFRVLIDRAAGSVHQEVAVAELASGGRADRHVHAFEQVLYLLSGRLSLDVAGSTEELAADDYVFVGRGVPHALRNEASEPARWLEASAPQPGAALEDTLFVPADAAFELPEPAFRRGRLEPDDLPPPSGAIGLTGFGGGNVGGASVRMLVDRELGASQLNLMVVEYVPGGFIAEHDHAFEEGFFFLTGEIEARLEGQTHVLQAGDYCWAGVGCMHALANRGDRPVRWLETQVPQPPSRYQARFVAEWERFLGRSAPGTEQ